jgi:hypothetical protein
MAKQKPYGDSTLHASPTPIVDKSKPLVLISYACRR